MSFITEIDHVSIAVHDLDAATEFFQRVFGLRVISTLTLPTDKYVMLGVAESFVQLLSPTSDQSPVAKFLDQNGEGVYKLAFRVSDCAAVIDHIRAEGVERIDDKPRAPKTNGIAGFAFIHPGEVHGTLIELVQRVDSTTVLDMIPPRGDAPV